MPFQWKRFWCPRTGTFNLSDDGYLLDPDSEFGKLANPDVVPFDSVLHLPCLALLGEPGIGKTYALKSELTRAEAGLPARGDQLLSFDLRSYTSDDRLCRALFEDTTVRRWLRGTSRLHLFLDSLDEGLLAIETLAALLLEEFTRRKFPTDRLSLRIACRTAEWRAELEEGLCALWGTDQFGAYELAPLRRTDVALAASDSNLDVDAFLREIDRTSAVPLAIRPVSLNFLLEEYTSEGQITGSMTELYRKGCEILCSEQNERRRRSHRVELLSAEERLLIAGRMAAATIFPNRDAIATRPNPGAADVAIADLTGGEEGQPGRTVRVNERAVREILNTGLFTSRGPGRMGWSHQTYAEFLAASHLMQAQSDAPANLVLLSIGGTTGVIPQLRGSAAWMAGMDPNMFSTLLEVDAPLLLGADLQSVDPGLRARLVDMLIERTATIGRLRFEPNWRSRYARLNHPGIEVQLRHYIADSSRGAHVQEFAIDIADACGVRGLAQELATLALDPAQDLGLRDTAARAVSAIGEATACARLLPLADGTTADPKEDLKGLALRANWPDRISATDLFRLLTPPRDEHYFGDYQGFILHELPRRLRAPDLPPALEWVSRQARRHFLPRPFRELINAVFTKAIEACTSSAAADVLAKALLARLRLHEEWVEELRDSEPASSLLEDTQRRRRLIDSILALPRDGIETRLLAAAEPPIVRRDDVLWLAGLLGTEASSQRRQSIAALVGRAADLMDVAHCDVILVASSTSPELRDIFEMFLGAIELGSAEAASMRDFYFGPLGPAHRPPARQLLDPTPEARIRDCLDNSEADVARAWPALISQLTLEPDSERYEDDWRADITTFPGWLATNQATREEIVACAARYLRREGPGLDEWVNSNVIDNRVVAGHRAIVLIASSLGFDSLKMTTLRRWMPAVLSDWHQRSDDVHKSLLRRAHTVAPRIFCTTLGIMIDRESRLHGHVSVTRLVQHIDGHDIERVLCSRLAMPSTAPEALRELGADLLRRGSRDGRVLLESIVAQDPPPRGRARHQAVAAARALVVGLEDAGWGAVWPVISGHRAFGREIVSAWIGEFDWNPTKGGSLAGLTEKSLADFFAWLVREFPYPSQAEEETAPSVRPIEGSSSLKTLVLSRLTEFGTTAAVEALRDLLQKHPRLDWLGHHIQECEQHTLARSWNPPTPRQIIDMFTSPRRVIVQDGNHLLDLLAVSLRRVQEELQGETPAAELLWDQRSNGVWRPKREESLTDYIARRLRSDLEERAVVANREVEVRRRPGAGRGSPTDIYVNAFRLEGNRRRGEPLKAIIEVKGCWNRQLLTAMETQLVGRYMKPAKCGHGLYVTGWYLCEDWDVSDPDRARVPGLTMVELDEKLAAQARELSGRHGLEVRAFVLDVRID
jgi:hypothetical protein